MTEARICPKCNGTMAQGRIMKYNEYSTKSQYMYVFAPDDDPAHDLSKVFSCKPLSKSRRALTAFCRETCGFTEFYGLAVG
jgi:hypothetical protein